MAMGDWVFYLVSFVLGAAALWLLYVALLKDRARGRRRCPKCWYDMTGAPPQSRTCSECGHTVKREQQFLKSRRRWGWAGLAMLLMLGSAATFAAPSVRRDGWVGPLPTTALILLAPAPKDVPRFQGLFITGGGPTATSWREHVFIELANRVREEKLWAWQWRWMTHRHWNNADPAWTFKMMTRSTWPMDQQAYACPVISRSDQNYLGLNYRSLRFRIEGGRPRRECAYVVHPYVFGLAQPTDPWTDTAMAINGNSTKFKLRVDRRTQSGEWQCVWKQTAEVFIVRDQADPPQLIADGSSALGHQLLRGMTFKVEPDALNVRWSNVRNATPLPTVALDFELLRDGVAVAKAQAWWTSEVDQQSPIVGPKAVPFHYRVSWDRPIAEDALGDASSSKWTLRISSNEELAWRDVESSRYWAGAYTIDLHWEMARRNWISASRAGGL